MSKALFCHGCGKQLHPDSCYDVVMYKRNTIDFKGTRSRSKLTLKHILLCEACAEKYFEFMSFYKKGGTFY